MDFTLNTKKQQEQMLKQIGVSSIEDLFSDIPKKILLKEKLKLPDGLSEQEVKELLFSISKKNANTTEFAYFLGAGVYNHFIPSAVWALVSRGEFLTSYTPYQPEVSQGMLQSIFEWQTSICELTGMEATNASTYDGAEAVAEAVLMVKNKTKRKKIVVSKALNPQYLQVAKTYAHSNNLEFVEVDFSHGVTSLEKLKSAVDENTAGVFLQHPNFFGCIEPLQEVEKIVHAKGAMFVVAIAELVSAGILKPPADFGADIVCGEAQSFGIPMSFGGPHCGFISVKMKDVRLLPGRIVGKTTDSKEREGYIMTLQAREQHIRREKSTSNLCTNQALFALAATIHISLLGKHGVQELAEQNLQRAHYAFEQLSKVSGVTTVFKSPFFNEFVVKVKNAKAVQEKLIDKKILFGLALADFFPQLQDCILVSVTEQNSKEQIDELAKAVLGVMK